MRLVTDCQACGSDKLRSVLHLGNLPLVNDYRKIGEPGREQVMYPAELLRCDECTLVQLGAVLPKEVLFPASYPYTSSTTRALRENFAELAREVRAMGLLRPGDLVVDIGGNDGNLLSNFVGDYRVMNVTPEDIGELAKSRGIVTLQGYWQSGIGGFIKEREGDARLITATNVFAHVEDPHGFIEEVLDLLAPDGVFMTESHYLGSLLANTEFDAVYHEHLRYYSLESLTRLLELHGLEVFNAKEIPSHGGSIRVYAARKGAHQKRAFAEEFQACDEEALDGFATNAGNVKRDLWEALTDSLVHIVHGVGAPSRAATLLAYCGIGAETVPVVYETKGSHKIGHYMPGTRIEVREEPAEFDGEDPDTLLLLAWHIAEELKERDKFQGDIIVPLPRAEFL